MRIYESVLNKAVMRKLHFELIDIISKDMSYGLNWVVNHNWACITVDCNVCLYI